MDSLGTVWSQLRGGALLFHPNPAAATSGWKLGENQALTGKRSQKSSVAITKISQAMYWKHTCTGEENRQFLEENDQVVKQFHGKRIHSLYPPKETLSLNQSSPNRKRKSKSNSILHLTPLFCVPALQSTTLSLSFVSIRVFQSLSRFSHKQLLPLHNCSPKAIPAEQRKGCPQRAGLRLTAPEAEPSR